MKTLEQFQHEMWLQNCDERVAWSQPISTEATLYQKKMKHIYRKSILLFI